MNIFNRKPKPTPVLASPTKTYEKTGKKFMATTSFFADQQVTNKQIYALHHSKLNLDKIHTLNQCSTKLGDSCRQTHTSIIQIFNTYRTDKLVAKDKDGKDIIYALIENVLHSFFVGIYRDSSTGNVEPIFLLEDGEFYDCYRNTKYWVNYSQNAQNHTTNMPYEFVIYEPKDNGLMTKFLGIHPARKNKFGDNRDLIYPDSVFTNNLQYFKDMISVHMFDVDILRELQKLNKKDPKEWLLVGISEYSRNEPMEFVYIHNGWFYDNDNKKYVPYYETDIYKVYDANRIDHTPYVVYKFYKYDFWLSGEYELKFLGIAGKNDEMNIFASEQILYNYDFHRQTHTGNVIKNISWDVFIVLIGSYYLCEAAGDAIIIGDWWGAGGPENLWNSITTSVTDAANTIGSSVSGAAGYVGSGLEGMYASTINDIKELFSQNAVHVPNIHLPDIKPNLDTSHLGTPHLKPDIKPNLGTSHVDTSHLKPDINPKPQDINPKPQDINPKPQVPGLDTATSGTGTTVTHGLTHETNKLSDEIQKYQNDVNSGDTTAATSELSKITAHIDTIKKLVDEKIKNASTSSEIKTYLAIKANIDQVKTDLNTNPSSINWDAITGDLYNLQSSIPLHGASHYISEISKEWAKYQSDLANGNTADLAKDLEKLTIHNNELYNEIKQTLAQAAPNSAAHAKGEAMKHVSESLANYLQNPTGTPPYDFISALNGDLSTVSHTGTYHYINDLIKEWERYASDINSNNTVDAAKVAEEIQKHIADLQTNLPKLIAETTDPKEAAELAKMQTQVANLSSSFTEVLNGSTPANVQQVIEALKHLDKEQISKSAEVASQNVGNAVGQKAADHASNMHIKEPVLKGTETQGEYASADQKACSDSLSSFFSTSNSGVLGLFGTVLVSTLPANPSSLCQQEASTLANEYNNGTAPPPLSNMDPAQAMQYIIQQASISAAVKESAKQIAEQTILKAYYESVQNAALQQQLATVEATAATEIAGLHHQLAYEKSELKTANSNLAHEKDKFDTEKGKYTNEKDKFETEKGKYAKEEDKYAKEKGKYAKEQNKYTNEKSKYTNAENQLTSTQNQLNFDNNVLNFGKNISSGATVVGEDIAEGVKQIAKELKLDAENPIVVANLTEAIMKTRKQREGISAIEDLNNLVTYVKGLKDVITGKKPYTPPVRRPNKGKLTPEEYKKLNEFFRYTRITPDPLFKQFEDLFPISNFVLDVKEHAEPQAAAAKTQKAIVEVQRKPAPGKYYYVGHYDESISDQKAYRAKRAELKYYGKYIGRDNKNNTYIFLDDRNGNESRTSISSNDNKLGFAITRPPARPATAVK